MNGDKHLLFEGNVDIYLYGDHALMGEDFPKDKDGLYSKFYVAGCKNFVLQDNRKIGWNDVDEFNIPSFIRVYVTENDIDEDENIDIILDRVSPKDTKINRCLYFGSYPANTGFPYYNMDWNYFSESDLVEHYLGFVVLLNRE